MEYFVARDRLLQAMGSQFFTDAVVAFLSILAEADTDYRRARGWGFGAMHPQAPASPDPEELVRGRRGVAPSRRVEHERCPRADSELVEHVMHVDLHGARADEQPLRDLAVRSSPRIQGRKPPRSRGDSEIAGSTRAAGDAPSAPNRSSSSARRMRKITWSRTRGEARSVESNSGFARYAVTATSTAPV